MNAMNASLIHSPLFCEHARCSLVEAVKVRKGQAVSYIVWQMPESFYFKANQNQVYQIQSFTLKMIGWCAFIDAMVNDSYFRLRLGEYAKLWGTKAKFLNAMIIYRKNTGQQRSIVIQNSVNWGTLCEIC
jgi:hypothetical protein